MDRKSTRNYKEALEYVKTCKRIFVWVTGENDGHYLGINKRQAKEFLKAMKKIEDNELDCTASVNESDCFIN